MPRLLTIVFVCGVLVILAGYLRHAQAVEPIAKIDSTIHSINLPELDAPLPDKPGRESVQVNCGVCHSARYITMQPAFPRKTWEAEVTKMKKVFGAPVGDDQIPIIVDYLVSIRGISPAK